MKPQLDYYIGRAVTRVERNSEGFDIWLDGDIHIHANDLVDTEELNAVVGLGLLTVLKSSTDTTLVFGRSGTGTQDFKRITLTPTEYTIAAEGIDEPVYPQRAEVESFIPDDPSPERAVEGPESVPEATEASRKGKRSVNKQKAQEGSESDDKQEG